MEDERPNSRWWASPELPCYSGDPADGPAEEFIEEAERILKAYTMPDNMAVEFIIRHLHGKARCEILSVPDEEKDKSDKVLNIIKKVFGDSRPLTSLMSTFHGKQQHPGQTVLEFSQGLRTLAAQINSRRAGSVPDEMLRDRFIEGLASTPLKRELRRQVRGDATTTFSTIREEVLRWSREDEDPSENPTQYQHFIPPKPPSELEELKKEIAALKDTVKTMQVTITGMTMPRPRDSGPSNPAPKCFYCGKRGHIARFCRKKKQDEQPQNQRGGGKLAASTASSQAVGADNKAAYPDLTGRCPKAQVTIQDQYILLPVVTSAVVDGPLPQEEDRREKLVCPERGCGKTFTKRSKLKIHTMQHTGERPFKCSRDGCTWAFTTASKLKRHSAKHLNLRKYKCDQCDKSFMRPEHLKGHLITHTGVKPFTCPLEGCDSSFTARSSLYVHLNKHREADKMVFYCPIDGCSRKYTTKPLLRAHIVQHYMEVPEEGVVPRQEIAQLLRACNSDDDAEGKDRSQAGGQEEDGGQFREGGVEITRDQLTNATVSQLLSMPVTISVESSQPASETVPATAAIIQPTISLESSLHRPGLKNRSGCARTDFQSNHRVSGQAHQRLQQQQQKQEGEIFTTPDSSLDALSFRDPQTGLTFVHTQLLQDDLPQMVYYNGDTLGLTVDTGDLRQSVLDMVPSHFLFYQKTWQRPSLSRVLPGASGHALVKRVKGSK